MSRARGGIRRRLPGGRDTSSADRYVREWRRIGVPAARALGGRLMAMDPDIVIDVGNPSPVYLPISVARRIGDLWRLSGRPRCGDKAGHSARGER